MSSGPWTSSGFPGWNDPVQQGRPLQSYLVRMQNVPVVFSLLTKCLLHGFCLRKCSLGEIGRKEAFTLWLALKDRNRVEALRNDAVMLDFFLTQSSLLNIQFHLPAWIPTNFTRSFSKLELVTVKLPIPIVLILSHIC